MSDYVVTEDFHILLKFWLKISAKVLHVLLEVIIYICLKTTDSVVVLDKTTTSGFLHAVEHILTVTHTVKECSEGAKVLSITTEVKQVTINTLKLIHDSTNHLNALRQLNAHCLFNYSADSMTIDHSREIIETVGHCEGLRISHALKHLLDTAVDIAEMWNNALYSLTVKNGLKTEHTVSGRVLRTDIDDKFILAKQFHFLLYEIAIGIKRIL